MTFGSPSFGSASPTGPRRNHLGLPSSLVFLFTHATLFSDPGRPSTTSPLRLLCFGFWKADTIAACSFNIDEAVSSFRECGLPCGLRDSLCTLQPFRSALTAPPHGCNTRYEWLVRPCSTGTFTQLETPSFAWRTGEMFIARSHAHFVLFRIEQNGILLNSEEREIKDCFLSINIPCLRHFSRQTFHRATDRWVISILLSSASRTWNV